LNWLKISFLLNEGLKEKNISRFKAFCLLFDVQQRVVSAKI